MPPQAARILNAGCESAVDRARRRRGRPRRHRWSSRRKPGRRATMAV